MYTAADVLKEMHKKNEYCCIHSNADDTAKFVFGTVLGVDERFFAISMYSPDGVYDGILIRELSSIQYIEQPLQYIRKMNRLISYHKGIADETMPCSISDDILLCGLSCAKEKQKIVSLEINHSGITDIAGIVAETENDICVLKQIDEMGNEDGICYVPQNNITQICMNSSDEKRLAILYRSV